MDVGVGDELTFDIEGFPVSAKITNLRRVRWQAMRPNTTHVFSLNSLQHLPHIYIGSYNAATEEIRQQTQSKLLQLYPSLLIVNVKETIQSISEITEQVSWLMRFLAILTLINGGFILIGTVYSSHFMRIRECMLLRVMGAGPKTIYSILFSEYGALAILAAFCGFLLTYIVNSFVLASFFKTDPVIPYTYLLSLCCLLIFANLAVSFLSGRSVLRSSPLELLRGT